MALFIFISFLQRGNPQKGAYHVKPDHNHLQTHEGSGTPDGQVRYSLYQSGCRGQPTLQVKCGYGEKEHTNYYTGWIKGDEAQKFLRAGVKKGSLIYLAGDLDAKAWMSKEGKPGISLNIDVKDWGYASPGKAKDETAQSTGQQPAQPPVQTYAQPAYTSMGTPPEMQAQFEELGDDDELPF